MFGNSDYDPPKPSEARNGMKGMGNSGDTVYRIPPFYFLHCLDHTTNVTRLVQGPMTFIRQDNEVVVFGPEKMVTVPPRHYCVVQNPVQRGEDDEVITDKTGQVKLLFGQKQICLSSDPFPLYPGEILSEPVTALTVVKPHTALHLRAELDFTDDTNTNRVAGDEWLFEGPGTYVPRSEVEVVETRQARIIKPNQGLRLRALNSCIDKEGSSRVAGEEWLVRSIGAYLPGVFEEVVDVVKATILTEKQALQLRATRTFTDVYGKKRKNGEEWLVTMSDAETHLADVYEEIVSVQEITTLTSRQFCVVMDPVDSATGRPQLGRKKLVAGEKSFFLQPGEFLENGIEDVLVLQEDEGVVLTATEAYTDTDGTKRNAGDKWMVRGPEEMTPPVEVEVLQRRSAIPLDENEGIYVRDTRSGRVRSVVNQTYMLNEYEELWAKDLPDTVENLLLSGKDVIADRNEKGTPQPKKHRDKTRVVTFRVPHNAAVQVYNYKSKTARVVFGPDLVMLDCDEHFTLLSISGGKPKRPNVIKTICLYLGPDFMTDIVTVETADHARLHLQLSYNWCFSIDSKDKSHAAKIFSEPDFVGNACKAIASRIRGKVAGCQFDDFHKNSATIIRSSVFGMDDDGKIRKDLHFPTNCLSITSVDIQSVEPVDQRTRDALQKSVQLAIEITTSAQEAAARHRAQQTEQEARGRLERQRISDQSSAEVEKARLIELQAKSAAVESTGQAKAEAQARAEAAEIEGAAAVRQAQLKADAAKIEADSEFERLARAREAEVKYLQQQAELEMAKAKETAEIETKKFQQMVGAIGAETIQAIATSGPEMQVKLLQSLGVQSTIITDGNSPINLFNTAKGLIGGLNGAEGPTNGGSNGKASK